jgi:hypothetical protein
MNSEARRERKSEMETLLKSNELNEKKIENALEIKIDILIAEIQLLKKKKP